jgi:hypothetical protein
MKKVLVLYYSQSGQLRDIVDSVLAPLGDAGSEVELTVEALRPAPAYPFPWEPLAFCDVFPESVAGIACELEPPSFDPETDYDLVILAYTVWFLAPSIPMAAFLRSPAAEKVIRSRPVVTLIGCRNMWLLAQETVKRRIAELGGRLVGNIVLQDRTANLVGVATIAYWMFSGKKDRLFNMFPLPGIAEEDIRAARRFGRCIADALQRAPVELEQSRLNDLGAVRVIPAYILFENRIIRIFRVWSRFIRRKGGPGDPRRRGRVRLFLAYLLAAIVLIAPLATGVSLVARVLQRKKIDQQVDYFLNNRLVD